MAKAPTIGQQLMDAVQRFKGEVHVAFEMGAFTKEEVPVSDWATYQATAGRYAILLWSEVGGPPPTAKDLLRELSRHVEVEAARG